MPFTFIGLTSCKKSIHAAPLFRHLQNFFLNQIHLASLDICEWIPQLLILKVFSQDAPLITLKPCAILEIIGLISVLSVIFHMHLVIRTATAFCYQFRRGQFIFAVFHRLTVLGSGIFSMGLLVL